MRLWLCSLSICAWHLVMHCTFVIVGLRVGFQRISKSKQRSHSSKAFAVTAWQVPGKITRESNSLVKGSMV